MGVANKVGKRQLDRTDCAVRHMLQPRDDTRRVLQEMEPSFSGGQTCLCFFYPTRCSNILPKTIEAKAKKSFLLQQHSRIRVLGGAELSQGPIRLQVSEDPRLQNLDSGKHELRNGARDWSGDLYLEKSMDSSIAVDFHRAILIGQPIGPQNQRCRGSFLFVKCHEFVER